MRALLVTFLLSGLFSEALHSQIQVTGRQDITFGTLFPGIPERVLPTDGVRAGEFRIRGPRNMEILLQFTLPAFMTEPGTATMPLSYAANDGIDRPRGPGSAVAFDPTVDYTARLPNNRRARVYLGATASPSFSQTAGDYSAAVVLTVALTGN
jgi:hypothetical protein